MKTSITLFFFLQNHFCDKLQNIKKTKLVCVGFAWEVLTRLSAIWWKIEEEAEDAFTQPPEENTTCRKVNSSKHELCGNILTKWEYKRRSTCDSGDHTCSLALLLGVEAVPVAAAASVPELGASVGLLVVVPADVIFSTCSLVQNQPAARVQGYGLCGENVMR